MQSSRKITIALALTSFLSGAAVMIIELTGIRLLAPVFGASVFTWTSLIGCVLVAFSAGGFVGGIIADRASNMLTLSKLLMMSTVSTLLIPPLYG